MGRKKIATTTKTTTSNPVMRVLTAIIFFLAKIGDLTIIIIKAILFLLKISFSIIKRALAEIVYLLDRLFQKVKMLKLPGLPKIKFSALPQKRIIYAKKPASSFFQKPHTQKIKPKIFSVTFPRFRIPRLFLGFLLGFVVAVFIIFVPYNFYLFMKFLPNPNLLSQRDIPVTTQIFDRNGNLLYEIYTDENRKPVRLADIPDIVQKATIAIEDKNFYYHPGFSLSGITRAAKETFINHKTQGGSTLTQQLIKNALLTQEVTISRKIKEIILSIWAERIYTKNQILEMYLNQVPYGGTAWGIEAASETYFGKNVGDLNLAEAAYLAGLPAAPTLYSPYGSRPEMAKVRQIEVLNRMLADGYITQQEQQSAQNSPIALKSPIVNIKAPHFVMYVREYLTQKYGQRMVDKGGLRVTTSLDLFLQEKVQNIVTRNINQLQNLKVGNGAALITNPKSGEILSMIGSRDYFDDTNDGNVNVTISLRQPGSSIKIVNYAAALELGMTAASILEDSPVVFTAGGQPVYTPVNYDGKFHGTITLRNALGNSYNIPAVKVLNKIGVKTMIDMGKKMGITTWNDESRFGLSLTLGGGEVTMMDMNRVYGVLANQGHKTDLNPILKITDYTGSTIYEKNEIPSEPVIQSGIAFILSDILSDNSARTQAFGPNSSLVIPGKTVAVKTGTTNDKRDNWTFGFTPSFVVGVWVGNNNNSPMDPYLTSGVTGAAPIWNQIMTEVLQNKPNEPFGKPDNVVSMPCYGKMEYFIKGTEPQKGCTPLPASSPPS